MLKLIGGALSILVGVGLGGFAIYAGFLTDDPEVHIRRPIKLLGWAIGALCLGVYWIKGSFEERDRQEAIGAESSDST